jgi:hypothetical protein
MIPIINQLWSFLSMGPLLAHVIFSVNGATTCTCSVPHFGVSLAKVFPDQEPFTCCISESVCCWLWTECRNLTSLHIYLCERIYFSWVRPSQLLPKVHSFVSWTIQLWDWLVSYIKPCHASFEGLSYCLPLFLFQISSREMGLKVFSLAMVVHQLLMSSICC